MNTDTVGLGSNSYVVRLHIWTRVQTFRRTISRSKAQRSTFWESWWGAQQKSFIWDPT